LKPRILFLVPADYGALQSKGVEWMIRERDEGGFFERVVTLHPLASAPQIIDLDPVHRIYELPLGAALGPVAGWRSRLSAPYAVLRAFFTVVRIARDERVDLVRATDPYLMGLLGWWAARALRIPWCISLHAAYAKSFGLSPKRGFAFWLRRAAAAVPRFVVPRASLLLPVSEHLVPPLLRAGGDRRRIRVIPHGIDLTAYRRPPDPSIRVLLGIPPEAPVISWISRMSDDNYSDDMIAIVERVARLRPGAVFVLAGDGSKGQEVRRRLSSPAIATAVRMLPFQPPDRVAALRQMSRASVCLIGGFSLIEACAAGSAPVVYDVDWHREIVEDGVSGYVVSERDVAGVSAALVRLIDDPALAAALGQRARATVFARHDVLVTSAIKRACYEEMLHPQEQGT
jgi:glycosyltransferase involved in cell wall biosynthesis